MIPRISALGPLLPVIALLVLCTPAPTLAQHDAHTDQDAVGEKEHHESGHNQKFLDPELDVDRYSNTFESESREVFALREEITESMQLKPGMVVADIGAGTGAFLDPMVAAIGPDGHYYGVEISPRFTEHIKDRAVEAGYRNVTAVLSAFASATLPEASIDLAFICDTYHHFDDYESMLASLFYAVKPGGQMVIVDFDRRPGVSSQWTLDHVRASKEEFTAEIEAAGFELVEQVHIDGLEDNFFLRFRRP